MKEKKVKKRDQFEKKNMGEFELIFPSQQEQYSDYTKFIQAAKSTWEDFNSGTKMKKLIEQQLQQQALLQSTAQPKELANSIVSKEYVELNKGQLSMNSKNVTSKTMRS